MDLPQRKLEKNQKLGPKMPRMPRFITWGPVETSMRFRRQKIDGIKPNMWAVETSEYRMHILSFLGFSGAVAPMPSSLVHCYPDISLRCNHTTSGHSPRHCRQMSMPQNMPWSLWICRWPPFMSAASITLNCARRRCCDCCSITENDLYVRDLRWIVSWCGFYDDLSGK